MPGQAEVYRPLAGGDMAFPELSLAEQLERTWITEDMFAAYSRMHRLGHAHSIETWQGDELVGGVYGVALGGLFSGESMFHRARDASKVALAYLIEYLRVRVSGSPRARDGVRAVMPRAPRATRLRRARRRSEPGCEPRGAALPTRQGPRVRATRWQARKCATSYDLPVQHERIGTALRTGAGGALTERHRDQRRSTRYR